MGPRPPPFVARSSPLLPRRRLLVGLRSWAGFILAFGFFGRDAPLLADLRFHLVDDVALVLEVGGGFGRGVAAAVGPAGLEDGRAEVGQLVEGFVSAGDFGADG